MTKILTLAKMESTNAEALVLRNVFAFLEALKVRVVAMIEVQERNGSQVVL